MDAEFPFLESRPKSVAILGAGPSIATYVHLVTGVGSRRRVYDHTWAINAASASFQADLVFHMDDCFIQERRAANGNQTIAGLLETLATQEGPPILTSVVRDGYPRLWPYPLASVLKAVGYSYFNSTAAYAVAFAIALGVERLGLYGCDFAYHDVLVAERGRGCMEFWLGFAIARGMVVQVAGDSTLLDACVPSRERWYGYDAFDVQVDWHDGCPDVSMTPRAESDIPLAEAMEHRYGGLAVSPVGGR